LPDDSVVL
jgi:hypothetical protein